MRSGVDESADALEWPGERPPWEIVAEALGRPFEQALWEHGVEQRRVVLEGGWGPPFWRVRKDLGPLERGSVIAQEGFIWTFPHIARVMHLGRGVRKHFTGPFVAEEKIDGYNVRIVRLGGRALALTRNGLPCPFATDRLRDFPGVLELLEQAPETIVCAEVAGRGNPYNVLAPPWLEDEVALFAFDLGALGPRRFVAPEQRLQRLERFGIRAAPLLGRFEPQEAGKLYEVLRALDRRGAEGIVMKSEDGERRLKYYCLGTNARDLRSSVGLLGSIDDAFVIHHIVQAACTLHEWEQGGGEAERLALGRALIDALLTSLEQVEAGADPEEPPDGFVEERFTVRLYEEQNAERLLGRLARSHTVQVRVLERVREPSGMWRLGFVKRYLKASGYFRTRLEGTAFID